MNLFDVAVLALGISAGVGGYRIGLVTRSLSWAGMAAGVVLAARFLPSAVGALDSTDSGARAMVAIAVLLGGAFGGQALGLLLGSRLHVVLPPTSRPFDRAGGAAAGVLGVLVSLWLLLPALSYVPGELATQARHSAIARVVAETAPPPPDTMQALRRLVGDTTFPQVFGTNRPAPDPGPPPAESGVAQGVLDAAVASVVQVEGPACSRVQEGSGFVVAPGLVATNAHVVAGEDETWVLTQQGRRLRATVVHFDPNRDLALLEVRIDAAPLPIGNAAIGDHGAVLGHPGGGPLEVSPFAVSDEVDATGRDLYDRSNTRRRVLILASALRPGDSGAPLLAPSGEVVGVAFAVAPDRPETAYALDDTELRAALAAPRAGKVDTGPCL